jgi:two-component system sensor histidine kinase UhpB
MLLANPSFQFMAEISKTQLRALLERMQARSEQDKIRLARDIHDDVSQKLTALSIELSLLQKRLGEKHSEFAKLSELLEWLGHVSRSVRKTTNELRPKILDEFGLIPAIKYECHRLERNGDHKIVFAAETEDLKLEKTRAGEIFRLFQDVISRTTEARISKAQVLVKSRNNHLQIEVIDYGKRPAKLNEDHATIQLNIQERLRRLGGRMEFSSRRGIGSITTLTIPIRQAAARKIKT